jgi:hypothetical protein
VSLGLHALKSIEREETHQEKETRETENEGLKEETNTN